MDPKTLRSACVSLSALALISCDVDAPPAVSSGQMRDGSAVRPVDGVLVRVAASKDCDDCTLDELAAAIRARPRATLPPNDLSWPVAPPGYRDAQGNEAAYRLVLKFSDSARVRAREDGQVQSLTRSPLGAVAELAREFEVSFEPLVRIPQAKLDDFARRAMLRSKTQQPDMAGLIAVDIPGSQRERMVEVGLAFQALDVVEFAEIEFLNPPPPEDIPPETPLFSDQQGYLDPDPGVNAKWAWEQGFLGEGIRLSDSEFGWWLEHEEFNEIDIGVEAGQNNSSNQANHGTAVLGVVVSQHNEYGMDGLAPLCSPVRVYPESGRRVEAVTNMNAESAAGDVTMLEQQTTGPGGGFGPSELSDGVWMASKMGTDAGVIVIGAAGNGGQDLDSSAYQEYMDRGDSGALIVGAGNSSDHSALGFSTYGSRVNIQGWGHNVATTGDFGEIFNGGGDNNQTYGSGFNGTSSATPVVTGAAALVSGFAKDMIGTPLTALEMREVLVSTGTPQSGSQEIGPLPNVQAAIESIDIPDNEVPVVTITSPSEDVETEADLYALTVEVDATDNIEVTEVRLEVDGAVWDVPDVEAPYAFDVTVEEGAHEIIALATDSTGNEGTSELLTVTVTVPSDPSSEDSESEEDSEDSEDDDGDDASDEESEDEESDGEETDGDGSEESEDDSEDDSDDSDDSESSGEPGACNCAAGSTGRSGWLTCLAILGFAGLARRRQRHEA